MSNHEVIMVKSLTEPLEFKLPNSCRVVELTPQRIKQWGVLQKSADEFNDITETLFEEEFGNDFTIQKERTILLYESDKLVGAITAWFGGHGYEDSMGRLHWLAVSPSSQGKGYGKLLVNLCLDRLYKLGHREVYLTTSTVRPIAIALYQKFGLTTI